MVELLAVIVLLSVVTGITVPVVSNVVNENKYKTLGFLVDSAEDFITDQWRVNKIDENDATDAFKVNFGNKRLPVGFVTATKALLFDMGIDSELVKKVEVMIDDDGISCVVIREIPVSSELYNTKYWVLSADNKYATPTPNNEHFYSKCCKLKNVLA